MKLKNTILILDNFRVVLSDYSLDIQDIVRSAILDGVNISSYIPSCKDNPYRLDQIRLAMKEGLPELYYRVSSGNLLYKIRKLHQRGTSLMFFERQLKMGNLNEEYLEYLLGWVEDGINVSKLNIAIIPKNLLDTFDYGLRAGFDMSIFNNGTSYSPKYIKLCLQIIDQSKPVSFLLDREWSLECLTVLSNFSKVSLEKWNMLVSYIDGGISAYRLEKLTKLVGSSVPIKRLQEKLSDGNYKYVDDCLDLVYEAFLSKLPYEGILSKTTDPNEMKALIDEMELNKRKRVSGRLRRLQ